MLHIPPPPPVHRGLTSLAHLLSQAQGWLTHSSSYSSNCSGTNTEMEIAHVEIPISNYLLPESEESAAYANGVLSIVGLMTSSSGSPYPPVVMGLLYRQFEY